MLRGEAIAGGELARVTGSGDVVRGAMGGFDRTSPGAQCPGRSGSEPDHGRPGRVDPQEVATPQPALDE